MYNILSIDFDWILNANQWLELNKFILSKVDNAQTIGFVKQHHHILHFLKPQTHITNIDHHHDIFYKPEFNNIINEGNWVNYCIKEKKIVGYEWIGNTKSLYIEDDLDVIRYLDFWNYGIVLDEIKITNFNAIVFVESFGYRHQTKNDQNVEFFMPWRITKQFIEKYHSEKVVLYNTSNQTKDFNYV